MHCYKIIKLLLFRRRLMRNASDIRVSIRKAMLFWTNPNANFTDIMHEIGSKRGVKCMRCKCPTIRIIELARDRYDGVIRVCGVP